MEDEQRTNMFKLRWINQVISQTPCGPPITYIQDNMAIHDFDRAMVNISIGLSQDLMLDRLIRRIFISKTKREYATIKNERHHLVTP